MIWDRKALVGNFSIREFCCPGAAGYTRLAGNTQVDRTRNNAVNTQCKNPTQVIA
jgi:hypothetical protein